MTGRSHDEIARARRSKELAIAVADLPVSRQNSRGCQPRPLPARARSRIEDAPGSAYFVGSAVFHYLGPAFAVLLFARVAPLGVAWLRIATAAAVYAAWRRPWRLWPGLDRAAWRDDRRDGRHARVDERLLLPRDRAPAARDRGGDRVRARRRPRGARCAHGTKRRRARGRGRRSRAADARAARRAAPLGFALAFANAGLFALYITLAHRVSRLEHARRDRRARHGDARRDGSSSHRSGSSRRGRALGDPVALGAGLGVGVTSSVVPYVCDQLAMARMARSTYALLVALLPATADGRSAWSCSRRCRARSSSPRSRS